MKKYIVLLLVFVFILTGCANKEGVKFKNDYESANGEVNKNGKERRVVNIDKDNPFREVSADDIVNKINKGDTFYVYFGSRLCPWCRSVIEKAIEVSKNKGIKTIYYVDIWDDDGNEILRDKYILDGNTPKLDVNGTDSYYELLKVFDKLLDNYTLTDDNGNKIEVGERRIFAPNFIYVKNGKVERVTDGISDKQKDSREELTREILKDEEDEFDKFFRG